MWIWVYMYKYDICLCWLVKAWYDAVYVLQKYSETLMAGFNLCEKYCAIIVIHKYKFHAFLCSHFIQFDIHSNPVDSVYRCVINNILFKLITMDQNAATDEASLIFCRNTNNYQFFFMFLRRIFISNKERINKSN